MARTKITKPRATQPPSSVTQWAIKTPSRAASSKTTCAPSRRPTTAQKTPAHLHVHVGQGKQGGKSYYACQQPKLRRKRQKIVAPPLRLKPVKRGAGVLHEIGFYQKSIFRLIPKESFERLVREIAQNNKFEVRFTPRAIEALQEAVEAALVQDLRDAQLLAFHARRVTLMRRDIQLLHRLRIPG